MPPEYRRTECEVRTNDEVRVSSGFTGRDSDLDLARAEGEVGSERVVYSGNISSASLSPTEIHERAHTSVEMLVARVIPGDVVSQQDNASLVRSTGGEGRSIPGDDLLLSAVPDITGGRLGDGEVPDVEGGASDGDAGCRDDSGGGEDGGEELGEHNVK